MVATLARQGYRRVIVPAANVAEAQLVGVAWRRSASTGSMTLHDWSPGRAAGPPAARPAGRRSSCPGPAEAGASRSGDGAALTGLVEPVDLVDIRGQGHARWALEVALAGGHNLLMVGPPGAGKTLLARSIPGLLPPLDDDEALEVTVIESVAGLLSARGDAPGCAVSGRSAHLITRARTPRSSAAGRTCCRVRRRSRTTACCFSTSLPSSIGRRWTRCDNRSKRA